MFGPAAVNCNKLEIGLLHLKCFVQAAAAAISKTITILSVFDVNYKSTTNTIDTKRND